MDRRTVLSSAAMAAVAGLIGLPAMADEHPPVSLGKPSPFGPDKLRRNAKELASRLYVPPQAVPEAWRKLSYEEYQHIWFDERHALWRKSDLPAEVDFFPAGYLFNRPVQINILSEGQSRPVLFDLDMFDKTDKFPDLPTEGMGYSGFRLRGELEKRGVFQEFAVFQGASYFRAVGRGQVYGLSARGLALGTGSPGGEEFPVFREFWIETPAPGASQLVLHALLDSPSVVGAYHFTIRHGSTTTIDVESFLYPRVDLSEAGIAPGTSMFLFDETNRPHFDDFRDAVHDSDGLQMVNGSGEQIWRPLANPGQLGLSYFVDSGTRGFGLMQRARRSGDFGDFEAHYERRPSLWVEPEGDWGPGSVMLIEIPADKEIYDNIVAFWRPADPLKAGQEHRFSYRLHWGEGSPIDGQVARIENTRSGLRVFEEGRIFTVDYARHAGLGDDPSKIEPHVKTSQGEIRNATVQFNPVTGGMRLAFTLDAAAGSRPEMRAELYRDGVRVSEVWLYRWNG